MTTLQGKLALVTGANGFIGSRIAKRLLREGVRVRALVRRPENHPELIELGCEVVRGDITDRATLPAALAGVELLVHCAAGLGRDMAESLLVNATGTRNVMDEALAAGVGRVVHISTVAVYDDAKCGPLVHEDTPMVVHKGVPYSVGKAAAEREAFAVAARGLNVVALRPTRVLGAHPSSTWGAKVPLAVKAGKIQLPDTGGAPFTYVHVDNLAEAVISAAVSEQAVGQAYNVSDGHVSWAEYANYFCERLGWAKPPVVPAASATALTLRGIPYDMAKAEKDLGYKVIHSFADGMDEQVAYLKAQGQ